MRFMSLPLAAMAAALFGTAAAQTQEEIERYKDMTIFAVGGSLAINVEPYRGLDEEVQIIPVPFFIFNKGNLTVAGPNISYRFYKPTKTTTVSFESRYRFQGYDASDSDFLAGMDDRDGTFEVGGRLVHRMGRLRIQLQAMSDVSGTHDGFEAEARATLEVSNGRMISLRPLGGVRFQSANFVDYYFGVENDEVTPERRFYDGDRTLVPFVGANARVRLTRRIQLNGSATMNLLPDDITNSPIVEKDRRIGAFMGISYLFSGPGVGGN
ncbi:MAG: MipA/OmpV family protein [Pseudomonadota bacterium]